MPARLLDGKQLSSDIEKSLLPRIEDLKKRGIIPGLAVILAGDDPASVSYVAGKEKRCAELGIASYEKRFPANVSEKEIVDAITGFNNDPLVHGILVQLPLPKGISETRVIEAISPEKDVVGFSPVNLGRMLRDMPCFLPCTPHGIIKLIELSGLPINGSSAVVVGRSNIVGKPLANLLIRKSMNATVTICHTGTKNLKEYTRQADILIACAGIPELIKADMIKPGACVIDVGVNRVDDPTKKKGWRLVGDVDFEGAMEIASYITPVPGGVGPMTIIMLLVNVVKAAEKND
jgi:methylenetetrahydrofolate dehydrogenase (NADP+)/methenyltetrahydrofolate cyclohydrolase